MDDKKKVKSLLICNSNMFIPTVLTEVISHPQNHYLVISDTNNIHRFFDFLALPNVDFIEYGFKGRFDFICAKRNLYERVSQYDIATVVFFHAEFGEMANWLIKKLSKTIPVYYCRIYDSIPAPHCRNLWKVLKIKFRQWLYWGVNMDVLENINAFPSIPQKFLTLVHASTVKLPVDPHLVSSVVVKNIKMDNLDASYVLLTGTVVATGRSDAATYEKLINNVIDTLGMEEIVSKCHPRFKELYGKEKLLRQLPSYIPGNVLIDNYECYIGFESTLLVEAAVAGKKSISLIDLLSLSDEKKQQCHDIFTARLHGKGQILYPKSIDELIIITSC